MSGLHGSADVQAVEAPVTLKAYLLCVFAAVGGIFFGYDLGYITGVLPTKAFVEAIEGESALFISSPRTSLIVSILSAGTFCGSLVAGDLADRYGRRMINIAGCVIYAAGVTLQLFPAESLAILVVGRLVAGLGVGFVGSIVILYMSEIAPRKFRGPIVAGYQFFSTVGLMLASIVTKFSRRRPDSGAYRIPIGLQYLWALALVSGLLFLPDSPRYFVKRGRIDQARAALARIRSQPRTSHFIEAELAEIVANAEIEARLIPTGSWYSSWAACFSGSWSDPASNLRRTFLGMTLQMMQQWTGINFIFLYSTAFLRSTGAIKDPFLMSMIFTIVNVVSTPLSFWTVERFGRRPLLIYGTASMCICQLLVAIIGITVGSNKVLITAGGGLIARNVSAVDAQVALIAIAIFSFASTWGPTSWILIGEIFPLPIRSRGVALSISSGWLWAVVVTVIAPYMVGRDKGNMRAAVFFVWGGACVLGVVYAYYLVPETRGLSLEQIDQMLSETTPRHSAKWRPTTTFAAEAGKIVGEPRVDKDEKLDEEAGVALA